MSRATGNLLLLAKRVLYHTLCRSDFVAYMRLRAFAVRTAARLNLYERRHLLLLQKHLKPGQTAIDVGANLGAYTLALARAVGPTGTVLAFEPLADVFELLRKSMAPYRNVHCFALALSSHGGTSEIRLPLIPGKILEPSLASLELAPGLPYESRTTQVAMLDDFLPRLTDVAFIKVDIEGHERAFLEGARRVIRTFKPLIQLEANDPTTQLASFQELAVELGYGIRSLGPGLSFVKVTQARALSENNFYFVPES